MSIQNYLDKIKNAIYGRDVRQAIHDAIHQCYEDGKAGEQDLIAREGVEEIRSNIANPNLLINGDFRNPVNQRGITKYEGQTAKGYTVDRWCMAEQDYQRTVEVIEGGVKITNPNVTYIGTFQQILEHPLPLGDYTITVKVKEISGGATVSCSGSHEATRKDLVVGINTLTLEGALINSVRVFLAQSSSVAIEYIKLEHGKIATSFVPRPYAEELALCQRYYTRLSTTYPMLVTQRSNADITTYIFIPTPQSLRAAPTIQYANVKLLQNGVGGTWWDVADVTCVGFSNMGATLQLTGQKNFEAGVPYYLILPNSGYIKMDAEIY